MPNHREIQEATWWDRKSRLDVPQHVNAILAIADDRIQQIKGEPLFPAKLARSISFGASGDLCTSLGAWSKAEGLPWRLGWVLGRDFLCRIRTFCASRTFGAKPLVVINFLLQPCGHHRIFMVQYL